MTMPQVNAMNVGEMVAYADKLLQTAVNQPNSPTAANYAGIAQALYARAAVSLARVSAVADIATSGIEIPDSKRKR